ncbi:Uncharacterized protein MA16_Dca001556 [Dendrobium catenatum]|uniref:Uncharacterized protein n=1 Tax=Dendrobium catenatum TaxID=906689 RepID=A0A2I0WMR1_9ASPA|nr:Uncharacterized protein MA16_Dca001556 [Dendrobium catenatum]
MVWSKGAWFFHGKPFLFQKWTKNFHPTRENFTTVPIWVRVHNLPLVCWNSEGISKIASKIGIPIAVDALTAAKTRLTYARICIQVSTTSLFPDLVSVSIEGEILKLQIQYEWKPSPCDTCSSLAHTSSQCPSTQSSEQKAQFQNRGRSTSRKPQSKSQIRSSSRSQRYVPVFKPVNKNLNISTSNQIASTSVLSMVPPQVDIPTTIPPKAPPVTSSIAKVTVEQPAHTSIVREEIPSSNIPQDNDVVQEDAVNLQIPNLNSPNDEGLGDTDILANPPQFPPKIQITNKFSTLLSSEEHDTSGNDNDSTSFTESKSYAKDFKDYKKISPTTKGTRGKGSKKPATSSSKRK